MSRSTLRRLFPIPLALALAAGSATPRARATQTDPILEIAAARSTGAPAGTLVQIEAIFPAADLVQRAVPLQVLVRDLASGTHYARFALGGPVVTGDAPSLADGLDPGDVFGLLASGVPLPGARVLGMGADRLELLLPPGFDASAAEIQLFIVYEGDPILSNPAPLAGEGVTP